jgi:Uma2 family endonuclease
MATTTSGLMTFEEFEKLPEYAGKQELLEGELIELPPAKKGHNTIGERIFVILLHYLAANPDKAGSVLGRPHHEMGYRVTRNPDSWLVPDVSVTYSGQTGDDYYEGAPLLAVEIVSPSNTPEQIDRKIELYLAHGSHEVWVFYPKNVSVWVYRERTGTRFKGTLQSDLFPGLSINLDEIFAA